MKKTVFIFTIILVFIIQSANAQNPYASLEVEVDVLTLSDGKFKEHFTNDSIVRIGSALFNTITSKVVGFVTHEKEISSPEINPEVSQRFLSRDTLAKIYPELTPYQFASNRPIDGIDLDGLEYDDSKLKILRETGESKITITGQLTIKIKVINLSSSKIDPGVLDFHERKSSKAFDTSFRQIHTALPLDPFTGESPENKSNITVEAKNLNIDFEFISEHTKISDLNSGDIGLILVDDIPENSRLDPAGLALPGGPVYAIEIAFFNKKNNIDTHEKGHLVGDMSDWRKEQGALPGFLMSYEDDGNGYKLRKSDYENLLDHIIYRRATEKNPNFKERNVEQDARDFIDNNDMKTKNE